MKHKVEKNECGIQEWALIADAGEVLASGEALTAEEAYRLVREADMSAWHDGEVWHVG